MCVCHFVVLAVSYVKRSFSINNPGMDELDTDVSIVVTLTIFDHEGGSVAFM